ncbi:MAG: type II secretion system protein XpsN [Pseudoxanthomonas sp.]
MRIDSFGPRTWLLAALAGWALLVWVLALFGLGAQIRPLDDDPSLVTALPKLPQQVPERLGPLAQYSEIAARPLLSQNRKPQPFFIAGQEGGEQPQTFDFILTSVLITPQLQMAILQSAQGGEGVRLKIGDAPDSAPGWRVAEIHPRSVVIEGPEGPRTLELRVFDGLSGQPPSAAPAMPGAAPPVQPPTTAGPSPPTPVMTTPSRPMPVSPAATAGPAPPGSQPQAEAPMTTEQQMEAIRKRIEARRAQLRQQGQAPPPPNKTK